MGHYHHCVFELLKRCPCFSILCPNRVSALTLCQVDRSDAQRLRQGAAEKNFDPLAQKAKNRVGDDPFRRYTISLARLMAPPRLLLLGVHFCVTVKLVPPSLRLLVGITTLSL